MNPLEHEINRLKTLYYEMHELIRSQISLTNEAIFNNDVELSNKVILTESRVNSLETNIDKECEDFLALHQPVASDLRFAIALIKMAGSLERIGDHAYGLSRFVCDEKMKITGKIAKQVKLQEIFDIIDLMLVEVMEAFEKKDVKLAKEVIKRDKKIDKVNKKIPETIEKFADKNKDVPVSNLILISRSVGKLERVGDLIKNIAEESIFYTESTVIKHKKKNKKIRKRFES